MHADYLAKSPNPDKLQDLLDKLGAFMTGPGWTDEDIAGIAAPTLITVGDCDMVRLDHAVRFLQLRGGDVNGDFAGVPASHLAVFPGSTHFNGMARSGLVIDVVTTFLDAESTSTPSISIVLVPAPSMRAPIAARKLAMSAISGSRAALSITVVPRASTAAIIRFSVAPTLG